MLMRMLDKGLLTKVSKKVYLVEPFDQDAEEFLPDWHLLAEPLRYSIIILVPFLNQR